MMMMMLVMMKMQYEQCAKYADYCENSSKGHMIQAEGKHLIASLRKPETEILSHLSELESLL